MKANLEKSQWIEQNFLRLKFENYCCNKFRKNVTISSQVFGTLLFRKFGSLKKFRKQGKLKLAFKSLLRICLETVCASKLFFTLNFLIQFFFQGPVYFKALFKTKKICLDIKEMALAILSEKYNLEELRKFGIDLVLVDRIKDPTAKLPQIQLNVPQTQPNVPQTQLNVPHLSKKRPYLHSPQIDNKELLNQTQVFLGNRKIKKLPKDAKNNSSISGSKLFTSQLLIKLIQVI